MEIILKSKLSWIPFIPLTLLALGCKLVQEIFEEKTIFGLSGLMLDYIFLGAVALVFLFALLFCVTDKKISAYYLPHRNLAAGILGIILALAFAADGANEIFHILGSGTFEVLRVLDAALLLLSAVVFVVLGLTHSMRSNESKSFALFNIMPALLCAIRMIGCFVQFTTISIRLADVTSLACYIFATLFFFNYAVALSLTKAKNAVKSCFIFGFPTIAAMVPYAVVKLIFSFDTQNLMNNIQAAEMLLIGLYVLAFMVELSVFVPAAEDVNIIEEEEADDEEIEGVEVAPDLNADDIVVHIENGEDDADDDGSSYLITADTTDFLYQATKQEEENPDGNPASVNDTEGYLTEKTDEPEDEDPQAPINYEQRLDEIDKLILEISSQSD